MPVKPMLCESAEAFDSDEYQFEVKYDGERAVLFTNSTLLIQNRRGVDVTYRYPELKNVLNGKNAVLDGEIVVFENGVSSFDKLAQRSHLQKAFDIQLRMAKIPVTYVAFDILEIEGQDLKAMKLTDRKEILFREFKPIAGLFEWGIPLDKEGKGVALFEMAKQKGLEGLIAKHIDSPYQEGRRSPYWKKIKNVKTVDLIVVRYTENNAGIRLESADSGAFPSTAIQCSGAQSKLVKHLIDKHGGAFVEVKYLNITEGGRLRMPTFKGLKNGGCPPS